jgi:hypothetical protein
MHISSVNPRAARGLHTSQRSWKDIYPFIRIKGLSQFLREKSRSILLISLMSMNPPTERRNYAGAGRIILGSFRASLEMGSSPAGRTYRIPMILLCWRRSAIPDSPRAADYSDQPDCVKRKFGLIDKNVKTSKVMDRYPKMTNRTCMLSNA